MQIRNTLPNLQKTALFDTPKPVSTPAQAMQQCSTTERKNCLRQDKIPFTSLRSLFLNIKKSPLTKTETFGINLFDKAAQKEVRGFISYGPSEITAKNPVLKIYNDDNNDIGSVSVDYDEWNSKERLNHLNLFNYKSNILEKASIRLHMLLNNDQNYRGVGSAMIQAAVEKSLQTEANGRVYVLASNPNTPALNDPFVFYNKMGFTLMQPNKTAPNLEEIFNNCSELSYGKGSISLNELEKIIQKTDKTLPIDEQVLNIYKEVAESKHCRLDEVYLDFGAHMYLNDDKVQSLWLPKIKANPIFSESNRVK